MLLSSWSGKPAMTKKLPINDEVRARADTRIDDHFAFVRYMLDHPEVLDMVPDGTVIRGDDAPGAGGTWLAQSGARIEWSDVTVVGDPRPVHPSYSGNRIEGPEGSSTRRGSPERSTGVMR
jgi:hypothetical protein